MKWVYIALIVCLIIGPFDALYLYIRAEKRRDARRRQEQQKRETPDKEE